MRAAAVAARPGSPVGTGNPGIAATWQNEAGGVPFLRIPVKHRAIQAATAGESFR